MRWTRATSRACLLGALGVGPAAGQEPAPCDLRLEGTVTDALFEEVMPEVDVVVLDPDRHLHRATTTDARGAFVIEGLCPGPHQLRVAERFHAPLVQEVVLPSPPLTLELHDLDVPEVVVVSTPLGTEETRSAATIAGEALARTRGQDLAEAVAQVPGVVVQRGGADTSKPIVRGQVERRVLTLFDGVRHEGQKWGADHAPEIDPFAAHRLVVIKGAAGVRYGPDALGGVILVEPRPLRHAPGVDGEVHAVGATNGMRGTFAFRLDGAHARAPGLAWRVEANAGRGAALRAPGYVLGNTASGTWNAGATLGWSGGRTRLLLSYRHHALEAGVFYGVRATSPDDLAAAVARDVPEGADRWRASYAIDRPSQRVHHDTLLARAVFDLPAGEVVASYAFQHDRRVETEPVRASVTGPQYDFTLRTHALDLSFAHRRVHVGRANAQGTVGASGQVQENVYEGLALIPNYRSGELGLYAHERLWTGRFEVEVGARYDHRSQTAFLTRDAFRRHAARGTLDAEACDADEIARCPRAFHAGSVSVGALVRAVPDLLQLKLDLSSASRFPDVDELYAHGTAPTLPVYALGDPGLGTETAYGSSLTAQLDHPWVGAEVSGHGTWVDDFVFFGPAFTSSGRPAVEVLSRGAFPRFEHRARDAWFYGVDGAVTVAPAFPVSLAVQGALIRGQDAATREHLPFVPPDRVGGTLTWRPPQHRALVGSHLAVTGQYVARQHLVDPALDLAPPPGDYALLGVSAGFEVAVREGTLEIGVEGTNLTNARYRDYTSLHRYFAHEPGWDLRLRLTWRFERPATESP